MPLAYNSYIAVKLQTCEGCGVPAKIFSRKSGKALCHTCAAQNRKPIAKISEKRLSTMQEENLQNLIEDCDAVFSKYVRIRDADKDGICTCYTCGCRKRWQDMNCSHFIGRTSLMTRWEPLNAKTACVGCNQLAHGRLDVFERKLNEENKGVVEWLREQGNQVYKPSRIDLKELLCELRNKLRVVQTKLIYK